MTVPVFSLQDMAARFENLRRPWHENYKAMYSTVLGGIVTDPVLMAIPVDDHMVHRSDGVFDVFKCLGGRAYCQRQHLERLRQSAAALDLALPAEFEDIDEIIKATFQAGGYDNVYIRIMVSRGPGGFSTDPFECPASHLYVIAVRFKPVADEHYQKGVDIVTAPVPVKPPPYAGIKSVDYLTNVMVKKTALEAGVPFAVTWDEKGFLAEGSTENIILVSPDGELLAPEFDRVLKGITVTRALILAEQLVSEGLIKKVRNADIPRDLAARASEVMLCGTTMDVLPVTKWDGRPVGEGRPGPVAKRLLELMRGEMADNPEVITYLGK